MLPVAVLAGGLGTRVRHLTGPSMPKALLPVAGRPFVEHKLAELAAAGVTDVVFLIGHGSSSLRAFVGDGRRFGLAVKYREDGAQLLGTGGAVRSALDDLGPLFFLTYGDTLLEVPIVELERRFVSSTALGAMTVLGNHDMWETSNVDVSVDLVVAYDKPARPGTRRYLDYGFLALRSAAFDDTPAGPFDLESVIRALIEQQSLLAVPVSRRFHDIGNEAAIQETEAWLRGREAR